VGDPVTRETTVALIEVMKVFTAIPAGVEGVITEILVGAEQFVEYGQVLFRVRPMDSASALPPTSASGKTKRPRAR
jgi:biotin carboxyl carrier protein